MGTVTLDLLALLTAHSIVVARVRVAGAWDTMKADNVSTKLSNKWRNARIHTLVYRNVISEYLKSRFLTSWLLEIKEPVWLSFIIVFIITCCSIHNRKEVIWNNKITNHLFILFLPWSWCMWRWIWIIVLDGNLFHYEALTCDQFPKFLSPVFLASGFEMFVTVFLFRFCLDKNNLVKMFG